MAETKAANKAKNDHPKTLNVLIPRERKNQEDLVVWVNDKRYVIKRGVSVEVPYAVAKIIQNAERLREKAYEYDETHSRRN